MTSADSGKTSVVGIFVTLAGIVVLCVFARLVPHPPNFTPIAAAALFCGAICRRRFIAVCVPLAALLISDAFLGFYDVRLMVCVYASLILPTILGRFLEKKKSITRIVGCSLAGSVAFFLVSNFAFWLFSGFYSLSFAGITQCYINALPFFQNTIFGDLFWASSFFGAYALLASVSKESFAKNYESLNVAPTLQNS